MTQFFSLPDYTFEDIQVPAWVFPRSQAIAGLGETARDGEATEAPEVPASRRPAPHPGSVSTVCGGTTSWDAAPSQTPRSPSRIHEGDAEGEGPADGCVPQRQPLPDAAAQRTARWATPPAASWVEPRAEPERMANATVRGGDRGVAASAELTNDGAEASQA